MVSGLSRATGAVRAMGAATPVSVGLRALSAAAPAVGRRPSVGHDLPPVFGGSARCHRRCSWSRGTPPWAGWASAAAAAAAATSGVAGAHVLLVAWPAPSRAAASRGVRAAGPERMAPGATAPVSGSVAALSWCGAPASAIPAAIVATPPLAASPGCHPRALSPMVPASLAAARSLGAATVCPWAVRSASRLTVWRTSPGPLAVAAGLRAGGHCGAVGWGLGGAGGAGFGAQRRPLAADHLGASGDTRWKELGRCNHRFVNVFRDQECRRHSPLRAVAAAAAARPGVAHAARVEARAGGAVTASVRRFATRGPTLAGRWRVAAARRWAEAIDACGKERVQCKHCVFVVFRDQQRCCRFRAGGVAAAGRYRAAGARRAKVPAAGAAAGWRRVRAARRGAGVRAVVSSVVTAAPLRHAWRRP